MAKIAIEPVKARAALDQQDALEKTLQSLSREVDGILKGLRYKIAGRENIARRLSEAAGQITKESQSTRALRTALEEIIALYEQTENENRERVRVDKVDQIENVRDTYDKTTNTFDDDKSNGSYGANQGNMNAEKKGMWFFGFRWFEDEDLYAYIRQHGRYQGYSQTQIAHLMEQIDNEGCGYVAIVNNIFVEYEGREDEFERVFGFPMYDKDGKANYNYLLVDFYANTDDHYYLDEPQGANALVADVIRPYLNGREDEFRKKYGCDLLADATHFNEEARQKILDSFQGQSEVEYESGGLTVSSIENRFQHYLTEKGVNFSSEVWEGDIMPTGSDFDKLVEEGKSINILVSDFNLYNENGSAAATDVGGHWMTITGVTDDGRYIVSSWGSRYYLKPSELSNTSFFITDIS